MKIAKPKQKGYRYWAKKLDKAMGSLVREKGFCERCGAVGVKLDWSHVIGRGNKTLRWDIINSLCLCYRCHKFFWHDQPLEAAKWYQEKYPHRYTYLMKTKDILAKRTDDDYKIILEAIKVKDFDKLVTK